MELMLREASGRELCRVWPDPTVPASGTIQETHEYVFELRPVGTVPPLPRLFLDGEALRRDVPDEPNRVWWFWQVGFHAGEVELELEIVPGKRHAFSLVVDPDRRKLTRAHFHHMVREILDDTFALLSLSKFRLGVARGVGTRPPIARLEFLSSRLRDIEETVRAIARRPVSILQAEERLLPPHRSLPLTPRELLRSLTGRQLVQEPAEGESRLPPQMAGVFPTAIRKSVRIVGIDLREHRDIKYALRSWANWLGAVAERLVSQGDDVERRSEAQRWSQRCRRLSRRLFALLELPFFQEVADTGGPLQLTQIFRRKPDYRRFFGLYQDFHAGIANVLGDYLDVPLARTFELYEVWAFLRLARAAAEMFPDAAINTSDLFTAGGQGSVVIPRTAVCLRVADRLALCFQRTYREYWREPDGLGSYSRQMRPDVSLEMGQRSGPLRLVVLDAKYRVEDQLNDAIASIHMYRDALVHGDETGERGVVAGAYLLTPHLPTFGEDWRKTAMPGRLFHPEYRGHFRFGAVRLAPGMSRGEIQQVLQSILTDSLQPEGELYGIE